MVAMRILVISCFILVVSPSAKAEGSDWQDALSRALSALEQGKCHEVWLILIKWAERGEPAAWSGLAQSVLSVGLFPPGMSNDTITRSRYGLIVSALGAASNDPATVEIFVDLSKGFRSFDDGKLAACAVLDDRNRTQCVNQEIANGTLPTSNSFAAELQALAINAPGEVAKCHAMHHHDGREE